MKMRLAILILLMSHTLVAQTKKHWSSPDFLVLQYAGSIGYVSGGVGYQVFKSKAWTSFHFGHVPKAVGGPLNIFAGKLMFIRRQYVVSRRTTVSPFDAGLMISYHLGEDFRSRWPDRQYPKNYYWWQTSFRFHLDYQPSVTIRLRDYTSIKAVTGYVDVNANELYLISMFQNRHALTPADVLKLGIGTRLHF